MAQLVDKKKPKLSLPEFKAVDPKPKLSLGEFKPTHSPPPEGDRFSLPEDVRQQKLPKLDYWEGKDRWLTDTPEGRKRFMEMNPSMEWDEETQEFKKKKRPYEITGVEPRTRPPSWRESITDALGEDAIGHAGALGGGLYGAAKGAAVGGLPGAILGGMAGAGGGFMAGKPLGSGEKATAGETVREMFYGAVPPNIKLGAGAFKTALKEGGKFTAANEAAMQSEALLDEGKALSIAPSEVVKRGAIPAVLGGVIGGIAGRKSAVAAPARSDALEKTYKRFEPSEDAPKTVKDVIREKVDHARSKLLSKWHPLKALEDKIRKQYGLPKPKQDLAAKFEMLPGSTGKAEMDVRNFDTDITDKIHALAERSRLGGSSQQAREAVRKDFSVYAMLRRTEDRLKSNPELKRVEGYDLDGVARQLEEMKQSLGAERYGQLEEIAEAFQKHADAGLRLQLDSGRISQELYDKIKADNKFYAPFMVEKYNKRIEDAINAGSGVDTKKELTKAIKGIYDKDFKLVDIVEAQRAQLWKSRILAEKNSRMRDFMKIADEDTEGLFVKKLKKGEDTPPDFERVTVLEKGEAIEYAVSPDIAAPIKQFGQKEDNAAMGLLRHLALPFKYGATAGNVAFQAVNMLLADLPTAALVSKYGVEYGLANPVGTVKFIAGDYLPSLYAAISGNVGKGNKIYQDAANAGVLRSTLQSLITPESLAAYRKLDDGPNVLDSVAKVSNAIEESFKILGVKRALKAHGAKNVQELLEKNPEAITEIRRFMGSPDFARMGEVMGTANILYMFLNARTQGAARAINRFGSIDTPEGRAAWGKMGTAVGFPTAMLYAKNQSDYAEDFEKVPARTRENYFIIFQPWMSTNEHGEEFRDSFKIPKREEVKLLANSVEAAMDFYRERDPAGFKKWAINIVESMSPVNIEGKNATERIESIASGLNPAIKVIPEVFLSPKGRSYWMHRDLMTETLAKADPREQYHDRTPEAYITMAQYLDDKFGDKIPDALRSPIKLEGLTRGMTAGLLTQFAPKKEMAGRPEIYNHPVLRAVGQRFMASGYIEDSQERELFNRLKREAATETVVGLRATRRFMDKHRGKGTDAILGLALEEYPVKDEDGKPNLQNRKMVTRVRDAIISEMRGIKIKDKAIKSLAPEQRAEYILNRIEPLSDQGKEDYINEVARKRLISGETARHLVLKVAEQQEGDKTNPDQ